MERLLQLVHIYNLNLTEILEIIDNSKDDNIIDIIVNELENKCT